MKNGMCTVAMVLFASSDVIGFTSFRGCQYIKLLLFLLFEVQIIMQTYRVNYTVRRICQ